MNRCMDSTPRTTCTPRQQQGEQPAKTDEEALVFTQGADKKPPGKPTKHDSSSKSSLSLGSVSHHNKNPTIICKNCSKQGHVSAVCPTKKPPEQIHAIATEPDDASVSSEDNSILILAQVHSPPPDGTILTQEVNQMPRGPISLDLLLLDSQSTVYLFSQPGHDHNICPAKILI